MNKQELIEQIKGLKKFLINKSEYIEIDRVIELVSRLDEPQKVEVPHIVADYIEYTKVNEWDLQEAMDGVAYEDDKDLRKWFNNNIETFARAWLDGYTVEKEKRYLVKAKGVYLNSCLVFEKINKKWFFSSIYEIDHQRGHHTRKELEEGGFCDVFTSPLFEVEEVEE